MLYVLLVVLIAIAALLVYFFTARSPLPPETDSIIDSVLNHPLPELVTGQAGYATSDGLRIWYESIPPAGTPKGVILLIMSNGGSAFDWPPAFLRTLVDAGYQVIRYDHRSTGISDRVENWSRQKPYTLGEMAEDAVAVLDALEIPQAHLIGFSMGGMIAQEFALRHPERVSTLTLLSTSGFVGDPDLPGLSSGYFVSAFAESFPFLLYRLLGGERNLIRERIAKTILYSGSHDLDIREIAENTLYDLRKRRGVSITGAMQHHSAVTIAGSRYDRLPAITTPTLVVHGTADRLIPVQHGEKLVQLIPNAEPLWLEGVGHVFPYPNLNSVIETILAHLGNPPSLSAESVDTTP